MKLSAIHHVAIIVSVLPENLVRIGKPGTLSEAHHIKSNQINAKLRWAFTGVAI